jgi:hypothetical protein
MIIWKLGAISFTFELSAIFNLLRFDTTAALLAQFFVLHGAASLVLAAFVRLALPVRYREPRNGVLALLFSFSFFVPVLGLIGLISAVLIAAWLPRLMPDLPFGSINPVEFVFPRREVRRRYSQGGLQQRLKDLDIPESSRMQTLLALQAMPARLANPILREMLADPADDIRLVAYGMLDVQEKKINGRIHQELLKLAEARDPALRQITLRNLAELYWELVYGDLVQGDLRQHAIAESTRYLDEALKAAQADAGLWFLKGRLLHANRDLGAEEAFNLAVAHGIVESRVLAYRAEIAYYKRDFATVRALAAVLGKGQESPRLAPLVRYWTRTGSAA